MAAVRTQALAPGADFAAIARANSDREAEAGGDLGWVTRYQLDRFREAAIFGTPVGEVSQPFHLADGLYLFNVVDEVVRPPDASQLTGLRGSNPRHAAWKAAALPAELLPPGSVRNCSVQPQDPASVS
jgi:hypothetical protein